MRLLLFLSLFLCSALKERESKIYTLIRLQLRQSAQIERVPATENETEFAIRRKRRRRRKAQRTRSEYTQTATTPMSINYALVMC